MDLSSLTNAYVRPEMQMETLSLNQNFALKDGTIVDGALNPDTLKSTESKNLTNSLIPPELSSDMIPEDKTMLEVEPWKDRLSAQEMEIKPQEISAAEQNIYDDAGLKPAEINGREALIRDDIQLDLTDARGRNNLERMQTGLPPVDEQGDPYELHHVGQKNDGPLAELGWEEHRGKENNSILHPIRDGSEVEHDAGWDKTKNEHWKTRAETMTKEN